MGRFEQLSCQKNIFFKKKPFTYFATSHGKGPCDGLGGTIKRLATKASFQRCSEGRNSEQILTPTAFFEFCTENIKNINFDFTTPHKDYEDEGNLLPERHDQALTVAGTQKLHWFEPNRSKSERIHSFIIKLCEISICSECFKEP